MTTRFISYADAAKWFDNSLVLCNNIVEIDSDIFDNMQFSLEDEDGNYREIYQYYITDCNSDDVRCLSSWFSLLFSYSPLLDCYILCVDHWGTPWKSVMIEDKSPIFG
jgi:hypothetical protein